MWKNQIGHVVIEPVPMEAHQLIKEITCLLSWLKHSVCLTFARMPSRVAVATRSFVAVLLALARRFEVLLQVNRDSSAEQLVKAYRKLLLKTHPDKGGRKGDFQKLQKAKETWDEARKGATPQGGRRQEGRLAVDMSRATIRRFCSEPIKVKQHYLTD